MGEQLETWQAFEQIRKEFDVKDLFVNEKGDYDDALRRVWAINDDLLIVEQDIVPTLELVRDVVACKEPWCTCKYKVSYKDNVLQPYYLNYGFGFMKYSAKLRRELPVDTWFQVGEWDWFNLDSRINGELVAKGLEHHSHGEVKHVRNVDYYRTDGTGVAMVGH